MASEYRNWSGSVRFTPQHLHRPRSEAEVVEIVRDAGERGQTVRPLGSGHSSTPIFVSDQHLVSLDDMSGIVEADSEAQLATVLPGTGLSRLGDMLSSHGLAMENLGDVDYQSIAGAISTGTHGTGVRLGNLSSTLVGGTLVTGTGETVTFGTQAADDADDEMLYAAQVALGGLGIMTSLTLRLEPAYQLHRLNWCTSIDWVMEHFDELAAHNRHFDFYWYPRSDLAQVRTLNKPGEESDLMPPGAHIHEDTTGPNYEVLPNSRDLRFEEMEYMLPLTVGMDVFARVRERIKERHRQRVGWRVLVRTVAPDRGSLSTCYERPTMTIATLQNNELPYEEYFADIEPMLQDAGGRPHWAKKHTMTASGLAPLYPQWDSFQRVRSALDPHGVFLNDYLADLWGVEAT